VDAPRALTLTLVSESSPRFMRNRKTMAVAAIAASATAATMPPENPERSRSGVR
jgi:hypothetical protein